MFAIGPSTITYKKNEKVKERAKKENQNRSISYRESKVPFAALYILNLMIITLLKNTP